MINIKNVTIGFNQIANAVELVQGGYILGSKEGCKVKVNFFEDVNLKTQVVVVIPSELVAEWTDDQPLIDYVLNELGLIVKPNEEVF
jgi:hypothetical protein